MSCPHLFVSKKHKNGASQVQLQLDLYESLKTIGENIKKDGVFVPEVLRPLVEYVILETVVGPSHLAFLLNDGRVCRVGYSLLEDKLISLSERRKGRSTELGRDAPPNRDGSSGSARSSGNSVALRNLRGSVGIVGRPRGSLSILRDLQRGGMYFRPPIAASDVPEDVIEQCQMVLQGKSRQAIVRELQRTNLDVNAAVNNLLSREDELDFNSAAGVLGLDDDWGDDADDIFSLFQQSEGLIMDSEGDLTDEILDRTAASPRFRREILLDCDRNLGDHATYTDRRKRRRFEANLLRNSENYRSGDSSRPSWMSHLGIADEEEANKDGVTIKGTDGCIQLGDRLEFWTTISAESPPSHFIAIAALYTELVAINSRGELHQWKWQSPEPYNPHNINSQPFNLDQPDPDQTVNHRHPRVASLGISQEKIVSLSGCITRASIMTISGAVATWMDEIFFELFQSIVPASSAALNAASLTLSRLEHPATHFSELINEQVFRLSVAPLISVVQCASGALYWWGVLPSYIRQKITDKQKNPTGATSETKSTRQRNVSEGAEVPSKVSTATSLNPGDLVCMRNAPMFHAGALGFTLINGLPKVGVLLEDSWKPTDVCRFRVKSPSSLRSFSTDKLPASVSGKVSNSASAEAAHALTCPYAQEIAAAQAAAAASQVEHESSQMDTGAVEMPPPPSPASSTCSDHSGPVKVSPGTFKRKKAPGTSIDNGNLPSTSRPDAHQQSASQQPSTRQQPSTSKTPTASGQGKATSHDEEIEDWCLSDVYFVEDGRSQPVGVLMKLDGNIAAVKFLKEQDRACLAARCPVSPVCQFINYISKSGASATPSKPFAVPGSTSSQPSGGVVTQDPFSWINDCRLLNKSDIVQAMQPLGGGLPQRVPDFVQTTPRHITMSFLSSKSQTTVTNSNSSTTADAYKRKIISLAPENSRIHAIVGRFPVDDRLKTTPAGMRHFEYHVFNLNGKTVSSRRLPALAVNGGMIPGGGSEMVSSYSNITLTTPSERPLLLRDSAGVVFPFLPPSRPGQESWVLPPWLDLPPVQCAALAWINTSTRSPSSASKQDTKRGGNEGDARNAGSGAAADKKSSSSTVPDRQENDSRLLFGIVVTRETSLLQHIIRTDEAKVEEALRSLAATTPSRVETIACEMADGHRTIIHLAVLMCAPVVRETPEMVSSIENILKRNNSNSSANGSTTDGSGWTTIPPSSSSSSTQQLSSSIQKSIQSILNLTPGGQRSAGSTSSSIHDFFIRSSIEAAAAAASGTAGATSDTTAKTTAPSSSNSYFCHLSGLTSVEESNRRPAAHRIFRALMDNKRLRGLMPKLLASLSDDSLTPFMLAVQCKAYQVAAFILDFLIEMEGIQSDGSEEAKYQFRYARLMRYLYPSCARLDDSPLFNLAYNDTCSFTWTGPKHIRQDIFECRTCGLMDSLCCCSECARVCHKGHDCRLKRTSPTAYCDCWEKCRCRSLVSGYQDIRKDLFKRLLDYTDMVYLPNRMNDHLMVYLARRVWRQWIEQKQFKSTRRHGGGSGNGGSGSDRNRGATGGGSSSLDEPEHDLDPPVFSRQALEITLDSKAAVASLLCDSKKAFLSFTRGRYEDKKNKSVDSPCVQAIQSGSAMLDEFVVLLFCKYPVEFVQRLVNTLARSLSEHLARGGDRGAHQLMTLTFSSISQPSDDGSCDAFYYCQRGIARFVRSLARVYTGLMLTLVPDYNKKKGRLTVNQPDTLEVIRSIFSQLAPIALPELAFIASRIISPVRTGAILSLGSFELSSQLRDAVDTIRQVVLSEKRSRPAQVNNPYSNSSGHGPDCPNSVIRHLIYGFDGSDCTSSESLPTWINIKRQPLPVPTTRTNASDQLMEIEATSSSTPRQKRRRQESVNSDTPQSKHRRRHHHRKRHRHGDSNASAGGSGPSNPPAPPPSQFPIAVVEPMTTTTTTTATASNASATFTEMELTAPGDSDTDGDVRSNELYSSTTTTIAVVGDHHHHMEEEYFSETASEDETVSRSQLEAPGSQHSSISSTAATAGTTGSVILDSLDLSRREQQNESTANTTLGEEEGESTMVVTTYCGSDEEEDEMITEENNARNNAEMQELAESIGRSISRRQEREERRRQRQRRFARMQDDFDEEDNEEDTEEEEEDEDVEGSDISEDDEEEISIESGEDSDDSDDSESDSESDEEDGEGVEGEDESASETEEEEEEGEGEDGEERAISVMEDDDNEQADDRDEEDDEEAYSQESDSSPPPPPFAPWLRRRSVAGGSEAGEQGSSSTSATTQSGNAGGGGTEEGANANVSQPTTSTTAATTSSVSRPMSSTGSVMARLYSAALSSAFDRRNVRSGTSLNALTGWTPFGGPLSPSHGNGATDPTSASTAENNNANNNTSSSNAANVAAPSGNNNNNNPEPESSEVNNGGIRVTEVQLSRATGTLLRLIADVMADLVNQDGDDGEGGEEDDTDSHMRRCVSAPAIITPSVGVALSRKFRALARNRDGIFQVPPGCLLTPLRSLIVARPTDCVGRALICAAMGSILAPIWHWISECVDGLEVSLRARLAWNSRHPDVPATMFVNGDGGGKPKLRKHNPAKSTPQNTQDSTGDQGESTNMIGASDGGSVVGAENAAESNKPPSNRARALSYVLELMRSVENEQDSHVPAVDISLYKHAAYLLDSFIYFFRVFESTWPSGLLYHLVQLRDSLPEGISLDDEFEQLQSSLFQGHPLTQRAHSFFRRSMSTLCLSSPPVDVILNPAAESLPLVATPQALEPNATISTLFAVNNELYSDFSNVGGDAYSTTCDEACFRSGKNLNLEQRIARGGKFLDTVCHSGSTVMRWPCSLDNFKAAFGANISREPRSFVAERQSFSVKETRFRKDMERLRLSTKFDLSLEIDRDPSALILNTATQLNSELSSRLTQSAVHGSSLHLRDAASVVDLLRLHHEAATGAGSLSPQTSSPLLSSASSAVPQLLSRRVKVVFRGEPGEGSGVTRSFITSFTEAVIAETPLPDLSPLYPGAAGRNAHQEAHNNSARIATQTSLMAATSRLFNRLRLPLSSHSNSIAFASSTANNASATGSGSDGTSSAPIGSAASASRSRRSEIQAARNLFRSPFTSSVSINLAPPARTVQSHEELVESNVSSEPTAITMPIATTETVETTASVASEGGSLVGPERDPLFWQPGQAGFFSPRGVAKSLSSESPAFRARMDLYRCVGRVVGLSLLHSEICPISFNRHVLKYILGRPLRWHDFAFYNADIFEGLRQVLLPVARGENADIVSGFGLTFSLVLGHEEGGTATNSASPLLHELVPGGDDIEVDAKKAYEYVRRYAEFKMLDVAKDALEQIRQGVFDVLPANALDGLTPEDLRLLLNGIPDINVDALSSYTTFIDESNCGASLAAEGGSQQGGGADSGTDDCGGTAPSTPNPAKVRIGRLKRWFWQVVKGMTPRQRQDLVDRLFPLIRYRRPSSYEDCWLYFWTSSPALPPSALGFEPTPTIVIRPADDQPLPTANTCISRLYLPLYSSRQILREKLLFAIEIRSFGFV